MASTFTSNTGIEKIADGEQSGLWGQTTNLNLDIVDRSLNGSSDIVLSGTTHTLTTSNGVLSDGQFAVLVFTGTPSGTNTVSIEPNTAQKLYFVRNSTAQTVILSQGSGATVSIAPSTSRVVFTNGGGVGAAVSDITNTLAMGSVAISGGTITGITDLAVADGGTGASTAPVALTNLGLTATAAEINILDGVTASTAELNILDGVTATAAELNKLDGATATTSQLNFVTGVTSAIQTQLGTKAPLASPTFTGTPTAPTQTAGNNSTRLATTAYTDAAVAPLSGRNLIINGSGRINQMGYVSGTATSGANQFTLDQWFVVTSGQNLTFTGNDAGRTMTAPAGGVSQVIEGTNIVGGTYVINWTGTATATVNGVSRAKGATFTLPQNTNAKLIFSSGTYTDVQIEFGTVATAFERINIGLELALCQRYYWRGLHVESVNFPAYVLGSIMSFTVTWPVTMRAVPTVAAWTPGAVTANCTILAFNEATAHGARLLLVSTLLTPNANITFVSGNFFEAIARQTS